MASDITSGCTITNVTPALGIGTLMFLHIETAATAGNADYITLTPGSTYGTILNINACNLTDGSIEDPSWAPATGVITLGSGASKARSLLVIMRRP